MTFNFFILSLLKTTLIIVIILTTMRIFTTLILCTYLPILNKHICAINSETFCNFILDLLYGYYQLTIKIKKITDE